MKKKKLDEFTMWKALGCYAYFLYKTFNVPFDVFWETWAREDFFKKIEILGKAHDHYGLKYWDKRDKKRTFEEFEKEFKCKSVDARLQGKLLKKVKEILEK